MKRDYPSETADCILHNNVGRATARKSKNIYVSWATDFQRGMKQVIRRIIRLSTQPMHENKRESTKELIFGEKLKVRRAQSCSEVSDSIPRENKKPGRTRCPMEEAYGVKNPFTVGQAYHLNKLNGNSLWKGAIDKETNSLEKMECFKFKEPGFEPSDDYQKNTLRFHFEVKQDGRHKGRLVAGGHLVALMDGISSRSTVVKGISVRLLDLIAHRYNLKSLCGDIGNAFITAPCLEKVYAVAGPEFGDQQDSIVMIEKILYGLKSSSRAFRNYFADHLRSAGFQPTRYDRDVWIR